ncbi:endolytic transglycosylase MltG [Streptococcus oralis]|uniref:Endolytic murein transglycosylase n=1 Tax=Streptococcus oralis TaxID=1303 RepID=A0A4V1QCF2_STROR|nr:endolytic transglycosylase MltG [Streptococcus oralis]MCY7075039.1 endolytic transglycosylase MltG [Streptococcus oralis]RXX23539.1 endolytic transglycosylase MltG [Streptococcus oralis]
MSENSREEEKLSFKEQILRDLERARERERLAGEGDATPFIPPIENDTLSTFSDLEIEDSAENAVDDSLASIEDVLKKAPTVLPRKDSEPSEIVELKQEDSEPEEVTPTRIEAVEPKKDEKAFNEVTTRIAVSYKTADKVEAVSSLTGNEETFSSEATDRQTDLPSRSRREGVKPAKKKKKSKAKGCLLTFLVFLVLVAVGGYFGYGYVQESLKPVDASSKDYVTVQIPEGSNVQEIGSTLEKSGLVKHGLIFSLYAKYKNYSDLKSGYYNLKKSMSTDELIQELQKGGTPEPQEPILASLTIPEGYTLEQIAQTVGQLQGEFKESLTSEAFLAKVQDETFISQLVAKYPNLLGSLPTKDSGVRYRLEGYLFPATYTIKNSTTVESLIDEMVAAMDKALSPHYTTIKDKGLTVNELLSIASLVEKEGAKTEDRKTIAGVFYNRLNLGMPLQSNIAILYAEGKLGQKISLADDAAIDTNIDSPYNVYTHLGLMPGPVDSPSLDAIEASVNQTKSDYLYFVANVEDGKVYFAATKEEHDQNVAEHINSKLTQSSSSN